jgi:hypothetical protein
VSAARELLSGILARSIPREAVAWIDEASRDLSTVRDDEPARFPTLISLASRHVPRGPLAPTETERAQAFDVLEGWNPERWSLLDAARAVLVLSRRDVAEPGVVAALQECFRYADVGELVALHRALALLPDSRRFAWRAGEGCRSSMRAVFEAAACDTPLPFTVFDDRAWRQLVIKALFVEAPLWRVYGLDQRLDAELARMALDLADERRSAGRPVYPELWACLGRFAGERGRAALEQELAGTNQPGRRAAALALARAGEIERLAELSQREKDPVVRSAMESALKGRIHQSAFQT